MPHRLFDFDVAAATQVIEDLAEALDVVGFSKPLEKWEDEDSPVRAWAASLESKEADDALEAVEGQFAAIVADLPKWAKEAGLPPARVQEGVKLVKQAQAELRECCTYEDRG
jgi:hypothetical protein